jgi:RNA polymerase sigma-70 factor, ECF subfamily
MTVATRDGETDADDGPMNGRDVPASKPHGDAIGRRRMEDDSDSAGQKLHRDRDLVAAAQRGDRAAFRELYDAYHRRAFAVALGVVKNPEDALDVVQEAFVKVHKHIDGFQGTASFYTWLYRIVMNLSIDHVRRSKKSKQVDYDDGVARDDASAAAGPWPSFESPNPRRTVLRGELAGAIERALETLPEYHRAVIVLREVEGLSYEEMAEVLEVPKGTIMSRLFHARRKMQEALKGYLGDDLTIED